MTERACVGNRRPFSCSPFLTGTGISRASTLRTCDGSDGSFDSGSCRHRVVGPLRPLERAGRTAALNFPCGASPRTPTLAVGQEERRAVFPPLSSVALRFGQALSRHILTCFARSGIPRWLDHAPARHGSPWRTPPLDWSRWGQWKNAVWGMASLYGVLLPVGWHIKARPVFTKVVNVL